MSSSKYISTLQPRFFEEVIFFWVYFQLNFPAQILFKKSLLLTVFPANV